MESKLTTEISLAGTRAVPGSGARVPEGSAGHRMDRGALRGGGAAESSRINAASVEASNCM